MEKEPHYLGHRQRLRDRFFSGEEMPEYELLELLLFQGNPRKDTKPIAKKLLQAFGSLDRVLSADVSLLKAQGISQSSIVALKLVYHFHLKLLQHVMFQREPLDTFERIKTYCHRKLAPLMLESFHVIYMDAEYGVILDKTHQEGTFNHVTVYPRDIIKTALDYGASKIILAHNHPGGDPKPSFEDLQLTHKLIDLGRQLGIVVVDHIIVGHNEVVSLKALGSI